MSETLELVVFSLVALVGLGLLTTNSLLRVPRWLDPNDKLKETDPDRYGDPALKANWVRLTSYSAAAGLLFGIAALLLNLGFGWRQQTLVFATLGGYIFFQSLFTDFRLRNVERWGQRIANILSFAVGAYILSVYGNETNWVLYLCFIAATFAIGLIPGVGNSDGRAFMFLVIATYPVASISGIQWSAIFYLGAIVLYYLGMSVYHKEFRIRGLLTKFSFPLVPLIMAPVLVTVLFGRLLPGF